MTRIREVAERAGVSPATVSRALNGDPRITAPTREKVVAAAQELGYRPNLVARSLRRQETAKIGVVVSDIENPHFTHAVRAIEDHAFPRGYQVLLCNTDETPAKQHEYLEMLASERVLGVILVPADPDDPSIPALLGLGIPVVAFDRIVSDERADAVFVDNVEGARRATEHLLQLGRRRVAYVGGPTVIQTGHDRQRGYEEAVAAAGAEPIVALGGFRTEPARLVTRQLLAAHPEVDAIVAANNLMAIGVLRALREAGRVVPDDVALVGIDNPVWAEMIDPPLTTLAQPVRRMAIAAAELLLQRVKRERAQARHMVFQFELIVRASCGAGRESDRRDHEGTAPLASNHLPPSLETVRASITGEMAAGTMPES